jgi:hypothetical protein
LYAYHIQTFYIVHIFDIDAYWGGYTIGNAKGMYADDIHPSQHGHNSMASVILSVINPEFFNTYKYLKRQDGIYGAWTSLHLGLLDDSNELVYIDQQIKIKESTNIDLSTQGWQFNDTYYVQPIVGNFNYKMPKPKYGQMQFWNDRPIWCKMQASVDVNGNVTSPAVWVYADGTIVS